MTTAIAPPNVAFQTASDRLAKRQQQAREKATPKFHRLVHRWAAGEPVLEELKEAAERAGATDADIDALLESIREKNDIEGKLAKQYGADWRTLNFGDERIRLTTEIRAAEARVRDLNTQLRQTELKAHHYMLYTQRLARLSNDPVFTNVGE